MLIYPPDIVRNDADRPVVVFRNKVNAAENDEHIIFPIPQSVQFNDSASYNSTEIGFSGALIVGGARSSSASAAVQNTLGSALGAVPKDLASLSSLLARSGALGNNVKESSSVASQVTMNKNLVTEFSGMGTRQFSFTFKLVSKSRRETEIIKEIIDTFRKGLYPEGNALQLKYPPTWYINFQKGGKDIPYIPKIFETYLTSVNATYNSSGNMFHADGSPVETELQVSFMETRALTKRDIEKLIRKPFEAGDFESAITDDLAGVAKSIKENVAKAAAQSTNSANA